MDNITKEAFDEKFQEGLDTVLLALAEHEEIDPKKFYSLVCIAENLAFFSPVLYGLLKIADKNS